jgi:hypothetical protein
MDATNRLALFPFGYRRRIELIITYSAHLTGRFLPWHRLYLHTMEGLLRNKCGYKGYMTYWDWTIGRSSTRRPNLSNMTTDMMFCQIHTTSNILLFLTPIPQSVLGHFQMLAQISLLVTELFVTVSALIPQLILSNAISL